MSPSRLDDPESTAQSGLMAWRAGRALEHEYAEIAAGEDARKRWSARVREIGAEKGLRDPGRWVLRRRKIYAAMSEDEARACPTFADALGAAEGRTPALAARVEGFAEDRAVPEASILLAFALRTLCDAHAESVAETFERVRQEAEEFVAEATLARETHDAVEHALGRGGAPGLGEGTRGAGENRMVVAMLARACAEIERTGAHGRGGDVFEHLRGRAQRFVETAGWVRTIGAGMRAGALIEHRPEGDDAGAARAGEAALAGIPSAAAERVPSGEDEGAPGHERVAVAAAAGAMAGVAGADAGGAATAGAYAGEEEAPGPAPDDPTRGDEPPGGLEGLGPDGLGTLEEEGAEQWTWAPSGFDSEAMLDIEAEPSDALETSADVLEDLE